MNINRNLIVSKKQEWKIGKIEQKIYKQKQKIYELELDLKKLDQLSVDIEQKEFKEVFQSGMAQKLQELKQDLEESKQDLNDLKDGFQDYAFHGKKLTTIIPVMSKVSIPDQYFRKFNKELMAEATNIGYQAMDETLKELEKEQYGKS